MELRDKISSTLCNIVKEWDDVSEDCISVADAGFLIANGQCVPFAKAAIEKLQADKIVNPEDITVIEWKSDRFLAHVGLLIHGYFYDSSFRYGKKASRRMLNSLFASYIYRIDVIEEGHCGVLVEDKTNKIIFNPWPREGVAYIFYTEYRHNGLKYIK